MDRRQRLAEVIGSVAWGYVFLHLDINLGRLDILPNWLCYLWILRAIPVLETEEPSVRLLYPLGVFLGIVEGVEWIAVLFGVVLDHYLLTVLLTIISLYFHFQFFTNLAGVAKTYGCPQEKRILQLRTMRTIAMTLWALPFPWDEHMWMMVLLVGSNLVVAYWSCWTLFFLKDSLWKKQK